MRFFTSQLGKYLSSLLIVACTFVVFEKAQAQDGKALFMQKCASCHGIDRDLTGPALKGMEARAGSKQMLFDWIRNNQKVLASGQHAYYNELYTKWNKAQMNLYPDLTDADLEAINKYVEEWVPPAKPEAAPGAKGTTNYDWWVFAAILAIGFIFLLTHLNTGLRRLQQNADGLKGLPFVPFYRRKNHILIAVFVVVFAISYGIANQAIGLGNDKDYEPSQPIFFSHKVHAGTNGIQCLFCHTNARNGQYVGVPSTQTCMTCHAAINEYNGAALADADGMAVDGTAEIKKLYTYAGWNPDTKSYDKPAQPVEWMRVHILPDHVFFPHDNHVVNAQLDCAACHGHVEEMDVLTQYSDLTMSWCVNCHRATEVSQFKTNAYYSTYERLHEDLKSGKIKGVTAEEMGANECQKCHY